jgi:LmbE family N-acetylglucosaminyl deacetylase
MLSRTALRGVAGNLLSLGSETIWASYFATLSRLRAARPIAWQPVGNGRVLVVAPHPDDETLACGGTILKHRAAGDRVVVVIATDGRSSRAGGFSAAEMAARRREEAEEAMRRLDAELLWLGVPEGEWDQADLAHRIVGALRNVQPSVVYAPSPVDHHPEHLRTASAIAASLQGQHAPLVRVYELSVPLGAGLTTLISDTRACESRRRWALAAYATQRLGISGLRRLRRYAGLRYGCGLAEPFWQLDTAGYRAVVAAGDWLAHGTPFRGIRPRAWTDPLAFMYGNRERKRLLSLVGGGCQ